MAKDEDEGLLARGKKYLKERAAKRGKELEEKAAAKAKADEEKAAKAPETTPAPEGAGGYGGVGDAYRKRKTEELTDASFRSSNQGSTGRSTATERRARDKRLNGVSI